jgi:hypothetical protein
MSLINVCTRNHADRIVFCLSLFLNSNGEWGNTQWLGTAERRIAHINVASSNFGWMVTGYFLTYLLTYLLTHSLTPWCRTLFDKLILTQLVKKSCFLYGTRRLITVFTKVRHRNLSWASRIQFAPSIAVSPRSNLTFFFHCLGRTKESIQVRGALKHIATIIFLRWGVVAPRPTPKLEDHPLSAVRDWLFNIFAAPLRNWRTSLHPQPEDVPCRGDKGPTHHGYFDHFPLSLQTNAGIVPPQRLHPLLPTFLQIHNYLPTVSNFRLYTLSSRLNVLK